MVCTGWPFQPLPVAGVVAADEHLAAGGRGILKGPGEGADVATGLGFSSCHVLMVMVLSNGMKDVLNVLVPIDKAGRIVLPKVVRHELAIKPGDVLRVAIRGLVVTLTPSKETTGLVRQGKALVFSTTSDEVLTSGAVEALLEVEREEHYRRGAGCLPGIRHKP